MAVSWQTIDDVEMFPQLLLPGHSRPKKMMRDHHDVEGGDIRNIKDNEHDADDDDNLCHVCFFPMIWNQLIMNSRSLSRSFWKHASGELCLMENYLCVMSI